MIRQLLLLFALLSVMVPCAQIEIAAQENPAFLEDFAEVLHLDYVAAAEPEEPPEDIMVWVEMPKSVLEGETVVLRITIENGFLKEDFRISTVDIDGDFLDGFKVISIVPEPRHRDDSVGYMELEYPIDLSPREDWELEITLQAEKEGVYVGDVDVYAGDDYITRIAQARIY